jgi:mannose-6-phosphate isomerase-like protein (cupin superfamily)
MDSSGGLTRAQAGETMENPLTGERCKWHLTTAETDGRLARAELWIRPGRGALIRHAYRWSEARFELLAGRMGLELSGRRRLLGAGDRATVPAGVPHRWRAEGDDELHFLAELAPPLRVERMTETLCRLARQGKMDRRGRPRLLELAVFAREFDDELQVSLLPHRIQRPLFAALAGAARVAGVRRTRSVA